MPNVEIAEPAPLPHPPPWIPPDFTRNQGYLDSAPVGIEARFSWTIPGGNGSGVTIYDVEYNWLQTHDDLSKASGVVILLIPETQITHLVLRNWVVLLLVTGSIESMALPSLAE